MQLLITAYESVRLLSHCARIAFQYGS